MDIRGDVDGLATDDPYYDLFEGGYIKPEDFLDPEDALRVTEAMAVVQDFLDSLENSGKLELI